MRIISYNILNGGMGRVDPIAEVLEAQNADVIGLVEATSGDNVERIANRLGMDWVIAAKADHATALLSRWPIVYSVNHGALRPAITRSLLEAVVRDPAGQDWPIGVVHLHAHAAEADEQVRMNEVGAVLSVLAPHRDAERPHLLMGDFNANSPIQRIDPDRCKESTRKEWTQNGNQIPRRVIAELVRAEYVDTLQACRPHCAVTAGTFSTQHPGQRVDYIFAWNLDRGRLLRAWIERDRLAVYASDHFPVGAEIG